MSIYLCLRKGVESNGKFSYGLSDTSAHDLPRNKINCDAIRKAVEEVLEGISVSVSPCGPKFFQLWIGKEMTDYDIAISIRAINRLL